MRRYPPAFWCSLCVLQVFLPAGSGCSVDKAGLPVSSAAPTVSGSGTGGLVGTGTGGEIGLATGGSGDPGPGAVGSGGAGVIGPAETGGVGTGGIIAGSGGTTSGSGGTGDAVPGTGGMTVGTGGMMGGSGGMVGVGGAVGGGSGGAPSVPVSIPGCADGTREAFANVARFPAIAGCGGGWTVPGVLTPASLLPACARAAGNSGTRPNGVGCTVEDLCAIGWHVCLGARELTTLGVTCQDAGIRSGNNANPQFFATRQRGIQATSCMSNDINPMDVNNVHGCGNFGLPEDPNCASLDSQLSHTECDDNDPWSCDDRNSATDEALVVVKPGPGAGGVLCCRQGG